MKSAFLSTIVVFETNLPSNGIILHPIYVVNVVPLHQKQIAAERLRLS